jgi:hypothetical protein
MKAFVMTVTFQVGVNIIGLVKEFVHEITCLREDDFVPANRRYHKDSQVQRDQRTWVYKINQFERYEQ